MFIAIILYLPLCSLDPNFQGTLGYIYIEADRIVPVEAQHMHSEMVGIERNSVLEDSSHSPYIERPYELPKVVVQLGSAIVDGA